MPCTGLPISAPNISCLNFNLAWDISGATPILTITNASTVSNYANLKFWFYAVAPSGAAIYGEDLNTVSPLPTPDVTGVSWATKVITLPTPFGNPPCGQVEFSPTNPYIVYIYVQDIGFSTTSFFTYNKNTIIVRPNGNNSNSCGNFGNALVSMKVDCLNRNIMVFNSTNLIYNNILILPTDTLSTWTLVYPQAPGGDIPNVVVTNEPNVNFPVSVNSKGYVLYLQQYATYDYGDGITVKVQYKLFSKGGSAGLQFAINCNTNLCLLQCQMQKYYELSKSSCGTLESAEVTNKMVRMNWIFSEILTGIFQPLCGIDVPKLMDEIKAIGNFDDNCDCNCGGGDFGFSNPTGGGSASGSCCPLSTTVIDITTGNPPLNCPNGYFPANIYDPTHTIVIGNALSMSDEINIINSNPAWQAYGIAFDTGNCTVGFFPRPGVVTVPRVYVDPSGGGAGGGAGGGGASGGGGGVVIVSVVDPYGYPPSNAACTSGYFPAQVYSPDGSTIIGVAYNIAGVISIINSNPAWQAYGTAFVVDNCHIGFYPKPGGPPVFPPVVVTGTGGGGGGVTTDCVNGTQLYPVTISDICYPAGAPVTAASFPLNVYVDFDLGAGLEFIGNATSQANMIALLNAASSKPATITFSAGPTPDQVIVSNSNCLLYNGVITITADPDSNSYLLFGGNHVDLLATGNTGEANEYAFSVKSLSVLGKIGLAPKPFHTIKIGNTLLATDPVHGLVFFWDITNPLMPSFIRSIALTTLVGNNFTGVPTSETIASAAASPPGPVSSQYGLYFPTDYYASMSLSAIYVVESLTGSIWKLNMFDGGSGVIGGFQDDQLIGKCPRVLVAAAKTYLFFTQDGDLETATSQSSGVAVGDIVFLDTSVFNAGGLATSTILLNQVEYVWAASYDGAGNIYYVGHRGSVAVVAFATSLTPSARHLYVAGTGLFMQYRANSVYFNGDLFVTPQRFPGYNGMIINTATLSGPVAIAQFDQPTGSTIDGLFNFLPLGNCLGIMTSAAIPGGAPQYVALYKVTGQYLAHIPLADLTELFNVVAIPNISVTTPNNYLPA